MRYVEKYCRVRQTTDDANSLQCYICTYSACRVKIKLRILHAMTQFVEAPRYETDSRELDSRWCHWNFSLT